MKNLIAYFRGLNAYKKAIAENSDHAVFLDAVKQSNPKQDKLEVVRYRCTIDEEWINQIDIGLDAIAKAIAEERQFILSNGEIVPIEKIKHVSKDSVSHLARHSNLITKLPEEDEDLMPEKLYTVERYSDYAVYENRFLYMLLCYINDFVTIRYEAIVKYCSSYFATMTMNKVADKPGHKLEYKTNLVEQRSDDKFLLASSECKDAIDKINVLLKKVSVQLATPLMQEVAKVAMLKPPITKNNVLKMDRNFKAAFALYSYIITYKDLGYTVEEIKTVMNPFSEDASDDFAQTALLSSFISYQYGLGLKKQIKENFEADEKERINKEYFAKLEKLRRKVKENGGSLEEYAVLIEDRNKQLEKENEELVWCKQKIEKQKDKIARQTLEIQKLTSEVESLKLEIEELVRKHREEIENLNNQHEQMVRAMEERFRKEKEDMLSSFEAQKAQMLKKHAEELALCKQRENALLEQIRQNQIAFEKEKEDIGKRHAVEIGELDDKIAQKNERIDELNESIEDLKEHIVLLDGKITALRAKNGLIGKDEDFSDKEKYNELEEQIKVMKKIYSREWKKVKKRIKEEKGFYALTVKSEKERLKEEKESRRDDKTPAQDVENDKLAPQTQSDESEKTEKSESVMTSDERLAPVEEIKDENSNKETT